MYGNALTLITVINPFHYFQPQNIFQIKQNQITLGLKGSEDPGLYKEDAAGARAHRPLVVIVLRHLHLPLPPLNRDLNPRSTGAIYCEHRNWSTTKTTSASAASVAAAAEFLYKRGGRQWYQMLKVAVLSDILLAQLPSPPTFNFSGLSKVQTSDVVVRRIWVKPGAALFEFKLILDMQIKKYFSTRGTLKFECTEKF